MNFFRRILNMFIAVDDTANAVALNEFGPLRTVFVYGTLRQGFGNHRLLENPGVRYVGRDYLTGFRMVSCGGFPAIYPVDSGVPDSTIVGELYEVDDDTMVNLDRLEGVPYHYQRDKVMTINGTETWVYVQERSGNRPPVPSGDWLDARNGRWNAWSPIVEG